MSAGHQAISSLGVYVQAVTIAASGTGDVGSGITPGAYGSIAPALYRGLLIVGLTTASGQTTFFLKMNNVYTATLFASIIQETAGGSRALAASAATFTANDGTGRSLWTWSGAGWSNADIGTTKRIIIQG